MLGFRPAIWSGGDSASYVTTAVTLFPGTSRVSGYGLFLFLLRPFHSFTVVTAIAHLAGLAIAVFLYALLRRHGLPGWGATLAALPVLLDAYQIQLEHEILANAVFGFLVMAAVTLLLWWRGQRPLWATAAAALLGSCAVTSDSYTSAEPSSASCCSSARPRSPARGLAADSGAGASWGGPALFPWVTAVAILLVPNVTADFTERYALPALPLVGLAAALAFARPEPALKVAVSGPMPEQAGGSPDRQVIPARALAETTSSSQPAGS
jgi:hypothetical protein